MKNWKQSDEWKKYEKNIGRGNINGTNESMESLQRHGKVTLEANDPGSKNIELLSKLQTYLLYSTLNCGNLWNCEHRTTVS